jgi:hypothetical protein
VTLKLNEALPDIFPESTTTLGSVTTGQSSDFAVVKVNSSWSKTMSVTTLLIADLRSINNTHSLSKI